METNAQATPPIYALIESLWNIRGGSEGAASPELRDMWPEVGRAWAVGWAQELERDLDIIARDLKAANNADAPQDAVEPLENALWRLGAAREKFYAITALAFAVPSLRIKRDKRQTLTFQPPVEVVRSRLRQYAGDHPSATRVIELDGQVKAALLLRHQATHSLAPIVEAHSLTWYEAGFIRDGGVIGYRAFHLPPRGLEDVQDHAPPTLLRRALERASSGFSALTSAIEQLAELIGQVGEIGPPPRVWVALETDTVFLTREEASEASRLATLPRTP